jgi:glyoxylase-like metal-dependent hydrolase (beta-lactamase superfamily II)
MPYPDAENWYTRTDMGDGVTLFLEPHVDRLEQANFFHVKGRDRDLLIDSGMGIVPLRTSFPDLFDDARPIVAVATHTHLDHIGAVHEFDERWVHGAEAEDMANPTGGFTTLVCADFDPEIKALFVKAGYEPLGEYLIHALPYEGYDPHSYRLKGGAPTRILSDGDIVDLGDRQFEVLHVPGHSPGSIGLFEAATGGFFSGDAIHDGQLIDELSHSNVADYIRTMERLRALPVTVVHGGHCRSFGRARLVELVDAYLEAKRR